MDIALSIFALLAMLHFIFDGIIAPSSRMKKRHELMEFIEELKDYKAIDVEVKNQLLQSATRTVNRLGNVNLFSIYMFEKLRRSDDDFKNNIKIRLHRLNSTEDEKLKEFSKKYSLIILNVLYKNSFMWFIYLIPIVLLILCVYLSSKIGEKIKHKITHFTLRFLSMPVQRLDKVVPEKKRLKLV